MNSRPVFFLLAAACLGAAAQGDDPLKSSACGDAVARLEAARSAQDSAAATEALRSQAARACLGTAAPPQRPGRVAQPPIHVPPPRIEPPAPAATRPAPTPPAPPVAIDRPPAPALCDPGGGCWTPDGPQLRYVPPGFVGPRGPCIPQGGAVYCP